jgi:predicted HTH domain antitoxin
MSHRSLTIALTLYRSETFTLSQAAAYSHTSPAKVAAELRTRGITVREDLDEYDPT